MENLVEDTFLSPEMVKFSNEWKGRHRCVKIPHDNSDFTYMITNNEIGYFVTLKCKKCKAKIDITDYDNL